MGAPDLNDTLEKAANVVLETEAEQKSVPEIADAPDIIEQPNDSLRDIYAIETLNNAVPSYKTKDVEWYLSSDLETRKTKITGEINHRLYADSLGRELTTQGAIAADKIKISFGDDHTATARDIFNEESFGLVEFSSNDLNLDGFNQFVKSVQADNARRIKDPDSEPPVAKNPGYVVYAHG